MSELLSKTTSFLTNSLFTLSDTVAEILGITSLKYELYIEDAEEFQKEASFILFLIFFLKNFY